MAGEDEGWAASSLERALHTALVPGMALGQLMMVAAVVMSPAADPHQAALVAAHVAVGIVALLVHAGRLPLWMLAGGLDVLLLVDWGVAASIDGVLCFAATWMLHVSQLLPAMLMRGRESLAFSVLTGLVVPAGVGVLHPDWLLDLAIPLAIAGLGIRLGGRLALSFLRAFARRVDDEVRASWRERYGVAVASAASAHAAEHARTLHDTVINTLGAVASGGGATRNVRLVRERSARDVRTLEALLDGREVPAPVELALDPLAEEIGLGVRRNGLADDELARLAALIPDGVVRALHGAVREAVQNVAKHAGSTGEVEILVADDDGELSVTVADRGPGFDGRLVDGRGLAGSVFARAEAAGIATTLDTAPGSGTEIRFSYPLAPDAPGVGPTLAPTGREDFRETVEVILRRGCWLWVAAVVVVGVVIEATGRPGQISSTYAALALVAAVGYAAWQDTRARGHLGPALGALVVVSVPVVFLVAAAATDFGRRDVVSWHAIGVSAPLVILLVRARTRVPVVLGALGLVAASAAATAVVARDSTQAAAIVAVGTVPAVGVLAAWFVFTRTLERVGGRAAEAQRLAEEAGIERATREAASVARERWRHAGLSGCLSLLRGLAGDALDPVNPRTRAACEEEEAYLRQLTMLEPELFRMGYWLALALALARAHGVRLVVRTGALDVDDDATAALGGLLSEVVAASPAGSALTVSLFSTRGWLRFGLVGPSPMLAETVVRWRAPVGWHASVQTQAGSDIVEVVHQEVVT